MSLLDDVGGAFDGLADLAASAMLTRTTPGAYDPATGTLAAGSTTTCSCKAVLDASSSGALGFKFGTGLIQTGDMLALVPAHKLTFVPASGDKLTIAGTVYSVIANQPTYGAATPLLYSLLVRL